MEWLDYDIRLSPESWLFLLMIPAAIAFAVLVYRRTQPHVSRRRRRVLTAMRSLALVLLLLLLAEPVLNLLYKRAVPPTIVTLLDTSGSMGVADSLQRLGKAVRILESPEFDELRSTSEMEMWGFAQEPFRLDPDTLGRTVPGGTATDLSAALRQAVSATAATDGVAAVMLLSDGNHNFGADPLHAAREVDVPVFAVALTEGADGLKDIQISGAQLLGPAIAGKPLTVRVELRSWGLADRVSEVRLFEGDSTLAVHPVTLAGAGQIQRPSLELTPQEPGPHLYRVEVAPLEGEASRDNNQSLLAAHVERGRLSVCLVAGGPGPDYAFLRRSLSQDPTLVIDAFVQRADGAFYDRKVAELLDSVGSTPDVIAMVDVGSDLLDAGLGSAIAASVRRGSGLLYVGGPRSLATWNPGGELAPALPFRARAGSRLTRGHVTLRQAATGTGHPLTRTHLASPTHPATRGSELRGVTGIDVTAAALDDPWPRLPPLTGYLPGVEPRPGATVLIEGLSPSGAVPLVVLGGGSSAAGRAVAALSSGFWRLDLLSSGAGESPQTIRRFWRSAVRWLAVDDPGGRVRASTDRRVYMAGEPVEFTVQVFDELMRPHTGAQVTIELAEGASRIALEPDEGGGLYRGFWNGLGPGEYSFHAAAQLSESDPLRSSTGHFVIQAHSLEASDMRADPELLARLARATGGAFSEADSWTSLLRAMDAPTRLRQEQRAIHLWGQEWYLYVLVALLCAEWGIRKRQGML